MTSRFTMTTLAVECGHNTCSFRPRSSWFVQVVQKRTFCCVMSEARLEALRVFRQVQSAVSMYTALQLDDIIPRYRAAELRIASHYGHRNKAVEWFTIDYLEESSAFHSAVIW